MHRNLLWLALACLCNWLTPLSAQSYRWENLAGLGGGFGHVDGPVATAKILYPKSPVVDSQGNIFFVESYSRTIRKISPSGIVSTVAGNSKVRTPQDGSGTSASFYGPGSLVIDSADNLFVADYYAIRKVTPAGVVTTLAGKYGTTAVEVNGVGGNARFSAAEFLVIDSQNHLYSAGRFNGSIRKITPSGVVTTLAGKFNERGIIDGKGIAARFLWIDNLCIDPNGNVYVLGSGHIRKVAPDGTVTTPEELKSLPFFLNTMVFDAFGNMFYSSTFSGTIMKRSPTGAIITYAGNSFLAYLDGPVAQARFSFISDLFMDRTGRMLVVEANSIRSISNDAQVSTIIRNIGNPGKTDGTGTQARFTVPSLIFCTPQGSVITNERSNGDLRDTTPAGVVSTLVGGWALGETSTYSFGIADDLEPDGLGNLFVIENWHTSQIRKIGPDGTTLLTVTESSDGKSFNNPEAVVLDSKGNLFVADSWNHRICKITPNGICTTFAGAFDQYGYKDGQGSSSRFGYMGDMVVDSNDNLYVADSDAIRKITPQGRVSTFAGKAYNSGHVDGAKAIARIGTPYQMAIDGADHIYISDRSESTIRKVAPDGSVRTIGGTPGIYSSADGIGPLAQFCLPEGVAVDAQGTVYVTDTLNNRIVSGRIIQADMAVTGNSTPVLGGTSKPSLQNHTDLGAAKAGAGSVTRTFEIHSLGQEILSLTGVPRILIRGKHAADFAVTAEPALEIATGESSALSITFSPKATGLRQAEVVIESTDAQLHQFTFAIQGMGDTTLPALTLTKPVAGTFGSLSPIIVSGTASDDFAVGRVEVMLDGGPPVMADLSPVLPSKTRTFQAYLSPDEGFHTLQATAFDTSGNSRILMRTFTFVRQWRLVLHRQVPPAVTSKPDLAGSLTLKVDARRSRSLSQCEPQTASVQPGSDVQVSATAKSGYLFDHWSGLPASSQIAGNVVRWMMPTADVNGVTAVFTANPFLPTAETPPFPGNGSTVIFSGLAEPVRPTPWSNATVGHLSAILTRATGSITGTLGMDGVVQPFNAQCFGDGSIWFRQTAGLLTRTLVLPQRGLSLTWTAQGISFAVSGPNSSLSRGWALPAVSPPPSLLSSQTRPALYTLIFPATAQTPEMPSNKYPQGTSYASGTLSALGSWPLAIVLADGTKATASPMLVRGNLIALFVPLTTPGTRQLGGSFSGALTFDTTQSDGDVSSTSIHWFRPAVTETSTTATQPYTEGWPQGLEMSAIGAKYDTSLTIQQALQLPPPDSVQGNVALTISEGGLPSPPALNPLGISGNTLLTTPSLTSGLTLSFTAGQAFFKGRFPPTWTQPAITLPEFHGIFIQKGTWRGGYGYFLSNRTSDRDPLSGRVLLVR